MASAATVGQGRLAGGLANSVRRALSAVVIARSKAEVVAEVVAEVGADDADKVAVWGKVVGMNLLFCGVNLLGRVN